MTQRRQQPHSKLVDAIPRLDTVSEIRQNVDVRVISLKPLTEFWQKHLDAERALRLWYKITAKADWASLRDVRRTYPHSDSVKTKRGDVLTVFNMGGNKYRLVARIRE